MAAVIRQPFHWISIRPLTVILLVVEGYTFERKHFSLFVRCCNDILYGSLAVTHLVLLLLKSVLLEEFCKTSVGDIAYHLLRKVCGLLCRNGLDNLTCLVSLLLCKPAL